MTTRTMAEVDTLRPAYPGVKIPANEWRAHYLHCRALGDTTEHAVTNATNVFLARYWADREARASKGVEDAPRTRGGSAVQGEMHK